MKDNLLLADLTTRMSAIDDVAESIRAAGADLAVVFVDATEALLTYSRAEATRFEIALVYRALRAFAGQYNVAVFADSQAVVDMYTSERPGVASLSEAKIGKGAVADVMIFVQREGRYTRLNFVGRRDFSDDPVELKFERGRLL